MKNLIISLASQKGGVGKTSLCSLLATYCVEQGLPVAVLDADTQLSLRKNRFDDLGYRNIEVPWQVWPFRLDDAVQERLSKVRKVPGIILIDCPGSVDNNNLKYVYHSADIIIMPFRFDRMNVRETASFAEVVKGISKAKRLFLPNLVTQYDDKREELRAAIEQANTALAKFGDVLPGIADSLDIRVSNTLGMNYKQRRVVRSSFNAIINIINEKIK